MLGPHIPPRALARTIRKVLRHAIVNHIATSNLLAQLAPDELAALESHFVEEARQAASRGEEAAFRRLWDERLDAFDALAERYGARQVVADWHYAGDLDALLRATSRRMKAGAFLGDLFLVAWLPSDSEGQAREQAAARLVKRPLQFSRVYTGAEFWIKDSQEAVERELLRRHGGPLEAAWKIEALPALFLSVRGGVIFEALSNGIKFNKLDRLIAAGQTSASRQSTRRTPPVPALRAFEAVQYGFLSGRLRLLVETNLFGRTFESMGEELVEGTDSESDAETPDVEDGLQASEAQAVRVEDAPLQTLLDKEMRGLVWEAIPEGRHSFFQDWLETGHLREVAERQGISYGAAQKRSQRWRDDYRREVADRVAYGDARYVEFFGTD